MSTRSRRVTVSEAARSFADLVNRAYYRHETTVLVRNGVAVAHIGPATPVGISANEARTRWRVLPHLNAQEGDDLSRDIVSGRSKLKSLRSPQD